MRAVAERFAKKKANMQAIAYYEKAYELAPEPKTLDSFYARAFLYERIGRTDEAIAMWKHIIEALGRDCGIIEGETADWPRRELKRLEQIAKTNS